MRLSQGMASTPVSDMTLQLRVCLPRGCASVPSSLPAMMTGKSCRASLIHRIHSSVVISVLFVVACDGTFVTATQLDHRLARPTAKSRLILTFECLPRGESLKYVTVSSVYFPI